jgi:hypothetical protein
LVARCVPAGKVFAEALRVAREITAAAPAVVRRLRCFLRVKREDLLTELEANAAQQASAFVRSTISANHAERRIGPIPRPEDS